MTVSRHILSRPRGNALAPVLMITGALAVSGLIFFFYTRKHIAGSNAEDAVPEVAEVARQTAPGGAPSPGGNSPAPPASPAQAVVTTPAPAPAASPAAKPAEVATQVLRRISAGDFAGASKLIASDDAQAGEVRGVLERIVRELGYKPGDQARVQVLGQVENTVRIAVPLASPVAGAPPARIVLDLQRDGRGGWKIVQMHLPKELEPALAAVAPASPAPGVLATPPRTPGAATAGAAPRTLIVVDREPDALTFASDFVHALLKPDYEGARRLVDQAKVPPVKLAALCIVFEEGTYRLADEKPLMSTVATESTSWVIARVRSAALDQQTEFGLEMERAGNEWRVGGLNLSKFLSDNARDSAIDGIPYTPLVHNPRGGEAIALFYEFDRADLHPRAQKQLDIIVQMLRNSPQKKLRISGFTDARGSDAYNLNLSRSRAEAVKKYILSRGVPLAQVETTGFGKALPISPNVRADGSDNPEGRSRNRRAEILLDF